MEMSGRASLEHSPRSESLEHAQRALSSLDSPRPLPLALTSTVGRSDAVRLARWAGWPRAQLLPDTI